MSKTKTLIYCSLFTALIAAGAFIKIPVPVVPFTLQYLFTMLAGLLLGSKRGTISVVANDMAGDSPDSWVCQFENAGFEVCPIIKGLGEYPGIRRMYVEHAQKAIDSMK